MSLADPSRPLSGIGVYLRDLQAFGGGKLRLAALLVGIGALLDGVGVALLVPLVAIFADSGESSGLAQAAIGWLRDVGLASTAQQVLAIIAIFLGLLVIRAVLAARRDVLLTEIGTGYVDHWRRRIFTAIGRADPLAAAAHRRTDLEHAVTQDVSRLGAGNAQLLQTGSMAALALVQVLLVALLSPLLLLAIGVLLAIVAIAAWPLIRHAARLGRHETEAGRDIHLVLGDFLASQKLARLHDGQEEFDRQFSQAIDEARRGVIDYSRSHSRFRAIFQVIAGLLGAAVVVLGLLVFDTPIEILAVVLLVIARLAQPVQSVLHAVQETAHMLPALGELLLIEQRLATEPRPAEAGGPQQSLRSGPAHLEIASVTFAYPGREPVLQDSSLEIRPGECVALSGPSGSGKTTLLEVMAGLLPASSGTIMLDGTALVSAQDFARWRAQMAFVPQNPFLFDASIAKNLVWGARETDETQIAQALQLARADNIVARLPQGLDTRVGDRGEALSGGERQRLCLARALLRQPRMLVLDEATNALDESTEDAVLTALRERRADFSILMVTHRQSALRHPDRVITLGS